MCATCISDLNYQCYSFPRAIVADDALISTGVFFVGTVSKYLLGNRMIAHTQSC
jgi:hypothetical protein